MSGRLIFGGYNDYLVHLWDTMQGVKVGCVFAHENRVTSLRRAPGTPGFSIFENFESFEKKSFRIFLFIS